MALNGAVLGRLRDQAQNKGPSGTHEFNQIKNKQTIWQEVPTTQTPFSKLDSGVGAIRAVEERLYRLMDRLVGPDLMDEADVQESAGSGLLGYVGEKGRELNRSAVAMHHYLSAIEKSLPPVPSGSTADFG